MTNNMHDTSHPATDGEKQYIEEVIGLPKGAGDGDAYGYNGEEAPKAEAKDKNGLEINQ